MTDREQTRRDAPHIIESESLVNVDTSGPHVSNCPGCTIDALLTELEQAERERDEWKRLAQERIPSQYNPWVPK